MKNIEKTIVILVLSLVLSVPIQAQSSQANVSAKLVPIISLLLSDTSSFTPAFPPQLSFVMPATNQQYTVGSNVIVEALASDSDGSVDRVELFVNGVFVRAERNPPYTWNDTTRGSADPVLSGLGVGVHQLRLDAYDNSGLRTQVGRSIQVVAVPVNQVPTVSFGTPSNNQSFIEGESVVVTANADDSDGSVARVELRVDGGVAQVDSASPYRWTLNNVSVGTHTLALTAVDNGGASSVVATRSIMVNAAPIDQPPSINVTAPSNNQVFTEGEAVAINVSASDSDGSLVRVDLYVDGVFESSDTAAPYVWSLNSLTEGSHSLRLVAVDDDGLEAEETVVITVNGTVVNPPNDDLRAGRAVLNVLRYRVAGTTGNAALDSGNFSNWSVGAQNNASVGVAVDNRSVTFSRNVMNDGSNARAYIEFIAGPVWDDSDLSVCMEVSGYDERNSGTRNVSLQIVGSHLSGTLTRTPTANGVWCSVLQVDANATTTVVRIGLGVTANDTRTNALTISNFSFSPTNDGLPNEYVAVQPQFSLPGNTTGWNGGVFNYTKSVSYNDNTGETLFTVPAAIDDTPAASHVMSMFDSYGGFVSRATTRWLLYGLERTPEYIMTNNARAGRALGDTHETSLLDDMYAAAPTPKPGIMLIRQAGNDLKVNAETATQTDMYLQWHIDWAQSNNMHVILTTATPFRGSSNWTQASQTQLETYNDLVRARMGQSGITVIDEYALLDTNNDQRIDGDADVPDSIDNGEGFAANDLVHATASGYRVLAEAHDAAIKEIINNAQSLPTDTVNAVINPSRTECASPCTIVFSADKTTAQGLDDHGIWSQLSYYWDFDTDETDVYGALYNQTYTYIDGDTSHEKGHVPMATKTFLCSTGACVYNVGMRAQNSASEFDDAFVTITVKSESAQWNAANTVCISNTLDVATDWTSFDKPCPAGAIKRNEMLDYDQYDGKLVLFKNGDSFTHNNDNDPNKLSIVVATLPNQSNFKLGVFGNRNEDKPNLDGEIDLANTNFGGPRNAPSAANTNNLTDALVALYGWPENIYIEGLKVGAVSMPMSYRHIGLHDLDMDRRTYRSGGRIDVANAATRCHGNSNLSCSSVPFPKGGYISSVNMVGFSVEDVPPTHKDYTGGPGVNIVQTACPMVNFLGITDVSVQRAREHNLRIAGWYRLNIMRSLFRGEHHLPSKQKITPRACNRSGGTWEDGAWFTAPDRPIDWDRDVEGRTRADAASTNPASIEFAHTSRYQVVAYNKIGDSSASVGTELGGVPYQTNQSRTNVIDLQMYTDVMVSHNQFEREAGVISTQDMAFQSNYGTCVANNYSQPGILCAPSTLPAAVFFRREPEPLTAPMKPGS